MKGFKYIEHEKYSAPQKTRRKVDGKWQYTRLAKRLRDFRQCVENRIAEMSTACRYVPRLFDDFKSYVDHDRLVTRLIAEGERNPSTMAKRKFFPHRPKIKNNRSKNYARRARRRKWQMANMGRSKGKKPAPALITNASQVRINQAEVGAKYYRAICRDQSTGRRNGMWTHLSGIGDRECARRRRQMERDGRGIEQCA